MTHEADVIGSGAHFAQLDNASAILNIRQFWLNLRAVHSEPEAWAAASLREMAGVDGNIREMLAKQSL